MKVFFIFVHKYRKLVRVLNGNSYKCMSWKRDLIRITVTTAVIYHGRTASDFVFLFKMIAFPLWGLWGCNCRAMEQEKPWYEVLLVPLHPQPQTFHPSCKDHPHPPRTGSDQLRQHDLRSTIFSPKQKQKIKISAPAKLLVEKYIKLLMHEEFELLWDQV